MPFDNQTDSLPLVPEGSASGAGGEEPTLVGGHCPQCARDYFPRPSFCPQCLEPTTERPLAGRGVIYSFTVVRTRPPLGLPQPYAVGYLDLEPSGLRVFGLLDPDDIPALAIGRRVRLKIGPMGLGRDGQPCRRPYFSLMDEGGAAEGGQS